MATSIERMSEILRNGPSRVVINAEGDGEPPFRARERGIEPDIIFIRRDGWSLGAPTRFEDIAFKLWSDEWEGYVRKPSVQMRPIMEYPQ